MYGVYVWLSCACLQNDRYVYLTVYVHRLTGVCVSDRLVVYVHNLAGVCV